MSENDENTAINPDSFDEYKKPYQLHPEDFGGGRKASRQTPDDIIENMYR